MKLRTGLICFAICAIFFLASCAKIELYQNLSEEDANEILVLLSTNSIKATKKKVMVQNETSYSIEVPEDQMARARQLLVQHNMPHKKELGLTGVYKDKGLIPTPDEQKARFLLAIKGEIINSLRKIPQVADADVVLNIPTRDEFANAEQQHEQRPTASIIVRLKPGIEQVESITEVKLQQFVSNAVEGLNPRDVSVIITYTPTDVREAKPGDVKALTPEWTPVAAPAAGALAKVVEEKPMDKEIIGLNMDEGSKQRLKIYLLIFFILLIILSAALIIVIVQGSRMRRTLAHIKGSYGDHPAIEGQVLDDSQRQLGGGESPPEDYR